MKFTIANIKTFQAEALAKGGEVVAYEDGMPGFGIRIRDGGGPNFFARYKIGKKYRRIMLGRYPKVPIEEARKSARQIFAKVANKIDPADDCARAIIAARDPGNEPYLDLAKTIARAIDDWVEVKMAAREAKQKRRPG